MQKAVPLVASTDQPVRAVKDGKVVGIVDREAILKAMAEDPGHLRQSRLRWQ